MFILPLLFLMYIQLSVKSVTNERLLYIKIVNNETQRNHNYSYHRHDIEQHFL